ncbi:MAG: 50S ribosomal protein L9 [Hyphomicrobiales bacterium]
MEVILLERIGRLGQMGDVVKVKDGYARNFLLPTGRALRATDANREKFERDRADLEAKNAERRDAAKGSAGSLEGKTYVIIRQAGESGQLYGSVSTRDIADAITAGGAQVQRTQVLLNAPIKTIGMHEVKVALHPEVIVTVTANVARSADEAEAQARGEVMIGSASEREEARRAAEALFEEEAAAEGADAEAETAPTE